MQTTQTLQTIHQAIAAPRQLRLQKLIQLDAPAVILKNEKQLLDDLDKVAGLAEYGDLVVTSSRETYGPKAGKYFVFTTAKGDIAFFPKWGGRLKPFQAAKQ